MLRLLRCFLLYSFCFAILFTARLSAAPVVAGVYNAASWIVPHQVNSGIAQGALFTVTGTGLGPSAIVHAYRNRNAHTVLSRRGKFHRDPGCGGELWDIRAE